MAAEYNVERQREYFRNGETKNLQFRKNALKSLLKNLEKYEVEILNALSQDLGKSSTEGYMTELMVLKGEINYILKRIKRWAKPQKAANNFALFPSKNYRYPEAYGVALIMSPWNYPLLLSLEPAVGAIAAGNCVVIKPSAYSPATSTIIAKIVAESFKPEHCTVVEGGREENAYLLEQEFDYIFFTGGTKVGKLVMSSAAKHLTPITLELGGKSPVIIEESANIDLTAKRIVFGKLVNCGQTCVAPDYILVPENKKDELIQSLIKWIETFYPQEKALDAKINIKDYPHIVNKKHFERIIKLLPATDAKEQIEYGGQYDSESLSIFPTILSNIDFSSPVMQEEIFGPIFPILTYKHLNEVIEHQKRLPKPLALYLFTQKESIKKHILKELSFGGGCINDTLMHVAASEIPFGGVGNSGMGSYHGKASFDTFTHYKSIVDRATFFDPSIRYRPFTQLKKKILRCL